MVERRLERDVAREIDRRQRSRRPAAPVRLVDARTLARALGVDRSWVYAHAEELHAVRIGKGRGRLRFDLDRVQRTVGSTGQAHNGRVKSSGRRRVMDMGGELLPVDP